MFNSLKNNSYTPGKFGYLCNCTEDLAAGVSLIKKKKIVQEGTTDPKHLYPLVTNRGQCFVYLPSFAQIQ